MIQIPDNLEEDAGAGVPEHLKPKVTGGLAGNVQAKQKTTDGEIQCRICLDDETTQLNPLITPCKCIGSVKHIHLDCLRSWLKLKKQDHEEAGVHSYYWE